MAVVQGGPAVPRAAYARVTNVAAAAGVVAVVDEDGLALVLLEDIFIFSRDSEPLMDVSKSCTYSPSAIF